MKKLLHWATALFSDSHFASMRRFIGLQAFYCLIAIVIVAIVTNVAFANLTLIQQIASYLFAIVMGTIVGTTVTDLAATIKASQMNDKKEEDSYNNPYYTPYDPNQIIDK